jgi:hypothetical protein
MSDGYNKNVQDNLEIFFYLKSGKKIRGKKLEEKLKEQIIPETQNENFKEIQEQIHSLCGDFYFSKNKFGAAIKQYKLCLDYNSGNIHAIVGLANSFQSLGLNDLSGEKFADSESFYAWKKTFLDNTLDNEQDSIPENPDDAGTDEFQYVPKSLLFNIAILEKSKRKFEYLSRVEPSVNFPESYVFIDNDESGKRNTDDKIFKLKNNIPELEKIKKHKKNQIIFDSTHYKINSENISFLTTIYSCVPDNILKSKKISALYFLYLLSDFTDDIILKNIIKELNIKIKINRNNDLKPENLNKKIFKHWLECVGDKKSLLSMNISDNALSPKKLIVDTISSGQIIKALNQQWIGFNPETICQNITSKNIAEILTEALEDYSLIINSNQKVGVENKEYNLILKIFEKKLEGTPETTKTKRKKPKKSKKNPISYAQLHVRIKNLRNNS